MPQVAPVSGRLIVSSQVLQLSGEDKKDRKNKRHSLSISGMRKVPSEPELPDDAAGFPGLVRHSEAAGPAGQLGAGAGAGEAQLREEVRGD